MYIQSSAKRFSQFRKTILTTALLSGASLSLTLPAAEYYVATNGSDGNNGTSIATPWRTVHYAVNFSGLIGGDIIRVRGGTFVERAIMTKSGSTGNPVTLSRYQNETPVLDGTGLSGTGRAVDGVLEVAASHIVVDGLRAINSSATGNSTGIIVRGPGVSDVIVRNCSTDNTRSSGIGVWGLTADYSGVTNVIIESNTITNAVNNGYQECLTINGGVDGFQIRNNIVRDSNNPPAYPNIPLGIDAKVNVRNGKISGNTVYNLPYCSGIYVDGWDNTAYNIEISSNIVHHVGHGGIQIGAEEGGSVHDITIFDNLIYNVSESGFGMNSSNISTPNDLRNIRFYHNTVYGSGYYAAHITSSPTPNTVIANNIFSQNGWSNAVTVYSGNKSNITMTNNITDGAQNAWMSGQEILLGSEAITQSPSFVDSSSRNFRLNAGSPAIDTGTSTYAASTDLDGNSRPAGNDYDLGAYEYGSSSTATVPSIQLVTDHFGTKNGDANFLGGADTNGDGRIDALDLSHAMRGR